MIESYTVPHDTRLRWNPIIDGVEYAMKRIKSIRSPVLRNIANACQIKDIKAPKTPANASIFSESGRSVTTKVRPLVRPPNCCANLSIAELIRSLKIVGVRNCNGGLSAGTNPPSPLVGVGCADDGMPVGLELVNGFGVCCTRGTPPL